MSKRLSKEDVNKLRRVLNELERASPCDKYSYAVWEYHEHDEENILLQEKIYEDTGSEHRPLINECTFCLCWEKFDETNDIGAIAKSVERW